MKKKIQVFFTVVTMLSLVLSVSLITSCDKEDEVKKPEPAENNQQPSQPVNSTDTTSSTVADTIQNTDLQDDLITELEGNYTHWECIYTHVTPNVVLSLYLFSNENKLFTTLSEPVDWIYFKNNTWKNYILVDTTRNIYNFYNENEGVNNYSNWYMINESDSIMTIMFAGMVSPMAGEPLSYYSFKLK